jgi:hypothetical protein
VASRASACSGGTASTVAVSERTQRRSASHHGPQLVRNGWFLHNGGIPVSSCLGSRVDVVSFRALFRS